MNPAGVAQTLPHGVEYIRILPEIVLSLFGMAIMLLDPLVDERSSQKLLGMIALAGSLAAIAATLYQSQFPGVGFWGMVQVDSFSIFFHFCRDRDYRRRHPHFLRVHAGAEDPRGGILRTDSVRRSRHVPDVVGGRTGADFHCAGDLFDFHLRSGRLPAARGDQQRSFA